MPEISVDTMTEVFVSETAISKAVSEAVARGKLRKLGTRLYTRNIEEAPERLVLRNLYSFITVSLRTNLSEGIVLWMECLSDGGAKIKTQLSRITKHIS